MQCEKKIVILMVTKIIMMMRLVKINGPCCHEFYIMMIESDSSSKQSKLVETTTLPYSHLNPAYLWVIRSIILEMSQSLSYLYFKMLLFKLMSNLFGPSLHLGFGFLHCWSYCNHSTWLSCLPGAIWIVDTGQTGGPNIYFGKAKIMFAKYYTIL